MTPKEFQKLLQEQVIVIDGAMGTMIQAYEFGPEAYGGEAFQMLSDLLVFSRPEAVKEVHLKYFKAGANAVETNSFGASPLRLAEFDLSKLDLAAFPKPADGVEITKLDLNQFTRRINKAAVEVAKQALEEYKASPEYNGRPLFVLGSIGPSNWVLSSTHADLHKGTFEKIMDNFYQQVWGLLEGGVDVLLFETQQDQLELKAAVLGAKQAMADFGKEVGIICQVTVDQFSRMQIFHTDILAALTTIQDLGVDAFGINCSIGPDQMLPTVEILSQHSKIPISIIPNAGLPQAEEGKTVFKLESEALAHYCEIFVRDYGVNIVGGCCGTTPEHIRAVAQKVGGSKPKVRPKPEGLYVSGPQKAIRIDGSNQLIRIGERLNVRGSKKVRDAVESGGPIDQDALEEVISEQVKDLGVEIIDVCMDSNLVNTADTLVKVIQQQTVDFPAAMCLDSFDVKALEESIKVYPGRPIVNSISLEEYEAGVDKVDAVLSVTKQHKPLYIALTTGPEGPAVTVAQKVDLARQIVGKAIEKHGCSPDQFLVDINAFPIGSESDEGMNFALESIQSIPKIKALYPGIRTTIGVGNLTNGLAKKPYMRTVLTSVFLDEARKVGLDAAIINPNHYVPVESLPQADYELGLKIVLERDMDCFAKLEEIAESKAGGPIKKKTNYEDLKAIPAICQKIKDGFKEREKGQFEYQGHTYEYQDKIALQTKEALETGIQPLDLINDHLMKAMEELGQGFAEGMVSLPHLLKAADVMKQVMGFLETFMKRQSGEADGAREFKATVVLGTVYQDVHSIGKDLAKTLLENYGYRVIDLGVQVPLQEFIDVAVREKAQAIGMSALLVQTSNHMITLAKMLKEQGLAERFHLLVGGAPVNRRHAAAVAMAGHELEASIKSDVFYCNSAMDGVNILNSLTDLSRRQQVLDDNRTSLLNALHRGQEQQEKIQELLQTLPERQVEHAHETPIPEHMGMEELHISLAELKPHLNQKLLFSLNWRFGGMGNLEQKGLSEADLKARLDEVLALAEKHGWYRPSAVYGFFPCRRNGSQVKVEYNGGVELIFNPVVGQGKKDQFSFAQFFKTTGDLLALQIATAGPQVDEVVAELAKEDQELAWLVQGLSDRIAEDLAELVQTRLEEKLFGKSHGQGLRCSPGYPAMTELSNNKIIFDLLEAGPRLGIRISEGNLYEPTGTTSAVVCFHPEASYH